MAERILEKKLKEDNRDDIKVSSASTYDMEGIPADPKAVEMLEDYGFDAGDHYSKVLTEGMISGADKILVMEQHHREFVCTNYPEAEERVFLLKPFLKSCAQSDNNDTENIKDPYNLSDYYYRLCFAELSLAIDGLLKCI